MSNEKLVAEMILEDPTKAPILFRRCIVDVMQKPQLLGKNIREKFEGACAICLASLEGAGSLRSGALVLTGQGQQRNALRRAAPDYTVKERLFNQLVEVVRFFPVADRPPITPAVKPGIQPKKPALPPAQELPSKAGFKKQIQPQHPGSGIKRPQNPNYKGGP